MAVWRRKPPAGLVHHTDRGAQYTALSFGKRLEEVDIALSVSRTGSALDNAMAESYVSTLEAEELVDRQSFPHAGGGQEYHLRLHMETLFYNWVRGHSSLGYLSPDDYEHKLQ